MTGFGEMRLIEAAAAPTDLASDGGAVIAAIEGAAGARFRVRILRAGLSLNGNFYPDEALREAVPLFERVRVIVKSDGEHLAARGKDPRAVLGRIIDVRFVPGTSADSGALEGVLEAIDPADPMIVKLREAVGRDMGDLFGLSIDASASFRVVDGARRVSAFRKVNSVDLIVEPGAGGRVLDVIEAADPQSEDPDMLRQKLIDAIRLHRPRLLEGRDVDAIADADLEALFTEALADQQPADPPPAPPAPPPTDPAPVREARPEPITRDDLDRTVRLVEARAAARDRVARSALPEAGRTRVLAALEAAGDFAGTTVDRAIAEELAYIARFSGDGRVAGLGEGRITWGESRGDKTRAMLEAFFDAAHKDHRHAGSFREIYVAITGDRRVTGQLRHCDQGLMREALDSATFFDVLGDAMNRRMIADYRTPGVYDIWRPLVTITQVSDFRTQTRTRFGGYGDLPAVAESADYLAVTSPGDEKAEYAVSKRGGLETITIETIRNDDVGVVQRIPIRLSRAAKRTLAKFALDFLRSNPTIYDTKALFHADHGNLGTTALSAASWAAVRLAMLKQTEAGSADRLGIGPRYLWVPPDLEQTAADIFRRDTNLDETFIQSLHPNIVPVWYWTDADDWCASADPADIPTIEIGFLDGNEEPELFVQDSPTGGSMFSSDQLTWKIRHIYGGNVLDYRGLAKNVVA